MEPAEETHSFQQIDPGLLTLANENFGQGPSQQQKRLPIRYAPEEGVVEILGVPLGIKTPEEFLESRIPEWSRFQNDIITDYDLRLMQKIAVALDLNQPILIEGGSGLGKSQTVDRVCALANWPSFYANCQDFTADVLIGSMTTLESSQTGFGWVDGVVLQAIRHGGVLFLDEYNFMRGDTRGRLHEILDSVLRGKPTITLIENGGEIVPVHPNFRIVAAQNPPGSDYLDREILDPAQISRFWYLKEPADLPHEVKEARALGIFGLRPQSTIRAEEWLSTEKSITREQLVASEDERRRTASRFIAIHMKIERDVESGVLGSDQPQTPHFVLDRDRNRIFSFMYRYFDGDLQSSLKRALHYYFEGYFETEIDRSKVRRIIESNMR